MDKKKKIIVIVVIAIIIIAIGVSIYFLTKDNDDSDNKKYDENLDNKDLDNINKPKKDESVLTNNKPLANTPFKNEAEGNAFRDWVNNFYPSWATENKLDRTGAFNNSYIKKAWAKFGNEYGQITGGPAQPTTSVYGFKTKAPVYIKSGKNAVVLFNYPEAKNEYAVRTLYKTQYLDKPIGIYLNDAVSGFIRIEDIYAPNKGKKYYVSIASVSNKKY